MDAPAAGNSGFSILASPTKYHVRRRPRTVYIYGRLGGRDPLAHGTEQDAELDILIIPYTPTETTEWNQVVPAFLLLKNCEMDHGRVLFGNNDATSTDKKGGHAVSRNLSYTIRKKKKRENKRKRTRGQGRPVGRCLRRTFVMCLAQSRASPARLPKK